MGINILFLIFYYILSGNVSPEIMYYISIIQCITGIYSIYREDNNPVNALFAFYISVILTNIANISLINSILANNNTTYRYIVPKYIDEATLIWCVGCSCIFIGYSVIKKNGLPSISKVIRKKSAYDILFYIFIFIALNELFRFALIIYQIKIIYNLVKLFIIALIIIFTRLWVLENNNTYRNYALTCLIFQTYVALNVSYLRLEILMPLMSFFTGYFLAIGIKNVFSYRVIPFIVIFIFFYQSFSELEGSRSHFIDVYINKFDNEEGSKGSEYFNNNNNNNNNTKKQSNLIDRSAVVAQLTNCVKIVKNNGFYNGTASLPLVAALIPRDLWPDKPTVSLGIWFAIEIGVAIKSTNSTSTNLLGNNSVNMTIPGELYVDFGHIGVIIGCILTGILLALFWNSTQFYNSAYNITGTLLGGYLLYQSVLGIGADLQIMVTFIATYISIYILKSFI